MGRTRTEITKDPTGGWTPLQCLSQEEKDILASFDIIEKEAIVNDDQLLATA